MIKSNFIFILFFCMVSIFAKSPSNVIYNFKRPVTNTIQQEPFTLITNRAITVRIINVGAFQSAQLQYKINLKDWNDYTIGDEIELKANDSVSFQNLTETFSIAENRFYKFVFSGEGNIKVKGNIQSLVNYSEQTGMYCSLFSGCEAVNDISQLVLPSTNLTKSCYREMFKNCINIKTVSKNLIPATELADACYYGMFDGCTSLTSAPLLPATELTKLCYSNMFKDCVNLPSAPVLPAKTVPNLYCYENMFKGCKTLRLIEVKFVSWENVSVDWIHNISGGGTFICPKSLSNEKDRFPKGWSVKFK